LSNGGSSTTNKRDKEGEIVDFVSFRNNLLSFFSMKNIFIS